MVFDFIPHSFKTDIFCNILQVNTYHNKKMFETLPLMFEDILHMISISPHGSMAERIVATWFCIIFSTCCNYSKQAAGKNVTSPEVHWI